MVTGASSGIGAQMVRLLAADGVAVVAVARRRERLDDLAAECGSVEVLAVDLLSSDGLEAAKQRLRVSERPIELLVNNAGFGNYGDFADLEPARLSDEIGLNIGALTQLTRAAIPPMLERGQGWIMNVSSVAGYQPGPKLAVYAATKAYVTSFSEAIHEELRGSGVHVTALCPGLTRTEFQEVSGTDRFAEMYPNAAWLSANDVARVGLRDAARGKALSIPGVQYKMITAVIDLTPRPLLRRMSGMVFNRR
jgi:short-subunit dehydrogenase